MQNAKSNVLSSIDFRMDEVVRITAKMLNFAVRVVSLCHVLDVWFRAVRSQGRQLMRSGMSIRAYIELIQNYEVKVQNYIFEFLILNFELFL